MESRLAKRKANEIMDSSNYTKIDSHVSRDNEEKGRTTKRTSSRTASFNNSASLSQKNSLTSAQMNAKKRKTMNSLSTDDKSWEELFDSSNLDKQDLTEDDTQPNINNIPRNVDKDSDELRVDEIIDSKKVSESEDNEEESEGDSEFEEDDSQKLSEKAHEIPTWTQLTNYSKWIQKRLEALKWINTYTNSLQSNEDNFSFSLKSEQDLKSYLSSPRCTSNNTKSEWVVIRDAKNKLVQLVETWDSQILSNTKMNNMS